MSVPLPTGTYQVLRPGQTPGSAVPGHASYRGGLDTTNSAGQRRQVGAWQLLLDPAAWPVDEVSTVVHVETGTPYRVHSAALRPGMLAHVTVDADLTTSNDSDELGVDAEGNVLAFPLGQVDSPTQTGWIDSAAWDDAAPWGEHDTGSDDFTAAAWDDTAPWGAHAPLTA